MEIDYSEIGKRIAKRRKELELRQSEVEEKADIGYKYLSSIENAVSIPSIEVVMKLADRIDTEKMREPAFMMVLCGVAPFAYKREDGVYVVPITCLKD